MFEKFQKLFGVPNDDDGYEEDSIENNEETSDTQNNKVVNIAATTQFQVVLVKPERFEEATEIADNLNAKITVVLNLEDTEKEISKRLLDFLSGVAYANKGVVTKVANHTYIITPYSVNFMGDFMDELENNGMFFQ